MMPANAMITSQGNVSASLQTGLIHQFFNNNNINLFYVLYYTDLKNLWHIFSDLFFTNSRLGSLTKLF